MQYTDLKELLDHIDPAILDYQEWVNVGMAPKHEGYTAADWDAWSMQDSARYHKNECFKKWDIFKGTGIPVTGAAITQMAKDRGWQPTRSGGRGLDWNDVIIGDDDLVTVDKGWIEGEEIQELKIWNLAKGLIAYLEALFDSDDKIGFVTKTWKSNGGEYKPTTGCSTKASGELIQDLIKYRDSTCFAIGDYNLEVGAWIRFNPLDGKSGKNENVADWRYVLVESDSMDLEKRNAIIRELELPVACLVYSSGRSIHATIHIDAADYHECRKRVDYLYMICKKNGLEVDQQNKDPPRLSRMPGVTRSGRKQFLIDTNIGKVSRNEWQEWTEFVNDDLSESERPEDCWGNLPDLAPPLIDGMLRQGHKMPVAGPSRAGKSFTPIGMCIAIAEGTKWFG